MARSQTAPAPAPSRAPAPAPAETPAPAEAKSSSRPRCRVPVDGKPCILGKDHEGDHKPYQRTVIKPLTAPLDDADEVPMSEGPVQVNEVTRDEHQLKVDANVKKAHEKWILAGKPADFNKSPRFRYVRAPEDIDAIRKMLERAGTFLGVHVKMSPTKRHEDGNAMVYFVVKDRKPRDKKPGDKKAE